MDWNDRQPSKPIISDISNISISDKSDISDISILSFIIVLSHLSFITVLSHLFYISFKLGLSILFVLSVLFLYVIEKYKYNKGSG